MALKVLVVSLRVPLTNLPVLSAPVLILQFRAVPLLFHRSVVPLIQSEPFTGMLVVFGAAVIASFRVIVYESYQAPLVALPAVIV